MEGGEKKKSGGGKLSRSETVTVRLDPQLRYLVELAARKQRRTVSSFIEWALEESLLKVEVSDELAFQGRKTLADEKQVLWDVDDSDRFAKLALNYPDMLNHHEQVLWKLIRENGYLWRGRMFNDKWTWKVNEGTLIYERLREYWGIFNDVADGKVSRSSLPLWAKKEKLEVSTDRSNDEIPF
jgi:hypothetical protein